MSKAVEIGCLEPAADGLCLRSPFFPSKFGGRPAWLSLSNIPSLERLSCGRCKLPMVFLLQIYAPSPDKQSTFHRTVFVFLCRNNACWTPGDLAGNVRVFRSQLARRNDFYNFEPLQPDSPDVQAALTTVDRLGGRLCAVCGIPAAHMCGKCRAISYCSRHHQKLHWSVDHGRRCGAADPPPPTNVDQVRCSSVLFAEFEIVTTVERFVDNKDKQERPNQQRMAEYHNYLKQANKSGASDPALAPFSVDELESMSKEVDKDFKKFRRRIEQTPYQVIRYHLGGQPLLASQSGCPQVQPCPSCGSARVFEFQIMPHLLTYMDLDEVSVNGVDWATLCVYTCSANCDHPDGGYCEEYVCKHDYNQ